MSESIYTQLGEEAGIAALVDRFYDLMDAKPAAATIRAMHPEDLTMARDKLRWFLCGWTGGPPLYTSRFGHPRLRGRHLPFPIDDDAAVQWMSCMAQALDEQVEDDWLRDQLKASFSRIALHMRNQ